MDAVRQDPVVAGTGVAGAGQGILDDRPDVGGVAAQDHDAVGHEDGFLDGMAHEDDGAGIPFGVLPDVDQLGPEALGGEGVHLAEGLVHDEHLGVHGQRPGHADALLAAPRQLPGVGFLEPLEADLGDGLVPLGADLVLRQAFRPQADAHVLLHGQPGEQGEVLEHHGHRGIQSPQPLAVGAHLALRGGREAGQEPEQRALPRAVRPQDGHHLVVVDLQIDVLEHAEILAARARERLLDAFQLADGRGGHGKSPSD